ncbi:haloacid dehalogenase-like hydrolase [Streptomyces sp. NPDC046161]|uniref:HAD family hydrolase n=1 Tax=Streptomyces sp. NPDC046161 TaxID=3155132 RepID=UPI0033E2353B
MTSSEQATRAQLELITAREPHLLSPPEKGRGAGEWDTDTVRGRATDLRGVSGSSAPRFAVFDLDGTLHPDAMGILLLRDLRAAGICRSAPTERLFEFLGCRDQDRLHEPHSVSTAYQLYAQALRGCDRHRVEDVARRLWEREVGNVFAYVAPVLRELRGRGTRLILISGSPQEVVEQVALTLGFHQWRGAVLAAEDGLYTGQYSRTPAVAGEKLALAAHLVGGRQHLAQCAAVGNSASDIELLAEVGRPVAFEAGPRLADAARRLGWPLADRSSLTTAMFGLPSR